MINVRMKGQNGEREIADDLNYILNSIYMRLGLHAPEKPLVQRNQNQSAVGGCDLTSTYGMAIEIKRQEQLSINMWWDQCLKSAKERCEHPVLLFRQNTKPGQRTKWRCITFVEVAGATAQCVPMRLRAELSYEDFKLWFEAWATVHIKAEFPHAEVVKNRQWPPPPPSVVNNSGVRVAPTRSLA